MKSRRIIKYAKLTDDLKLLLKSTYPNGFSAHATEFLDPRDGKSYWAVQMETDESIFLITLDTFNKKSQVVHTVTAEDDDEDDDDGGVDDLDSIDDKDIDVEDDDLDEDEDDSEDDDAEDDSDDDED